MPRMKILNSQEREAFESPPNFNNAERKRFFSLPLVLNRHSAPPLLQLRISIELNDAIRCGRLRESHA